jgi:hypothetical protein
MTEKAVEISITVKVKDEVIEISNSQYGKEGRRPYARRGKSANVTGQSTLPIVEAGATWIGKCMKN